MFGSEYDQLCARIITLLDSFGRLSVFTLDEWDERVALAICEATGMTLERWDHLGHQARIPWMEKAIAALVSTLSDVEPTEQKPDTKSPKPKTEGEQPPSLTQEDAAILKVLQANGTTMTVGSVESKVCFTDRTIRRRLKKTARVWIGSRAGKEKGLHRHREGIGCR